jgi:predicted permease
MLELVLPLYLYVILGIIAGRFLSVESQPIARLTIYLLTPIIIGGYVAQVPFQLTLLALPLAVFTVAAIVSFVAWAIIGSIPSIRPYRTLLGASGGMLNSGYFGISIAGSIIGADQLGTYMLAIFVLTLFEYIIGAYLINRHVASPKESFKRLIRLPGLYACLFGLLISALGIHIPAIALTTLGTLKSAYVVLGMMMLGLVLSQRRLQLNIHFLSAAFIVRFGVWFGATSLLLIVDRATLGLLAPPISESILWLMGFLPIGANVIAYAVDAEASPEQIAPAVVLSTLLSPVLLAFAF